MKNINISNILKFITIITITTILICSICNISLAADGKIETPDDVLPGDDDSLIDLGNIIIGILQWFGSAVAVIIIAVVGIKYMTASIEEKAEYKQTFIYYFIGAILIFGATNVLSWVYQALN